MLRDRVPRLFWVANFGFWAKLTEAFQSHFHFVQCSESTRKAVMGSHLFDQKQLPLIFLVGCLGYFIGVSQGFPETSVLLAEQNRNRSDNRQRAMTYFFEADDAPVDKKLHLLDFIESVYAREDEWLDKWVNRERQLAHTQEQESSKLIESPTMAKSPDCSSRTPCSASVCSRLLSGRNGLLHN